MIYRRVIGISGSLIWSKTLMELIFNSCGEFLWSPEGPLSQIHSPHLHVAAPGIFSRLLRSAQMLKREWGAESNGNLLHYSSLVKLQTLFLSLRWKTCLWAELHHWCLSLQCKTCSWTEHSDDDDFTFMPSLHLVQHFFRRIKFVFVVFYFISSLQHVQHVFLEELRLFLRENFFRRTVHL